MGDNEAGPPLVPIDFSRQSVASAVLKNALGHPLVTIPAAVGIVASVATAVLGSPLVIGAIGLIAPIVFGVKYFLRYDAEAAKYLEAIRSVQRQLVAELPKRLRITLSEACSTRGLRQLDEMENSFGDLQYLLERKFSRSGMTLGRFLGTAEQVRVGALYQLQMILGQTKAIESIPDDLKSRLDGQDHNEETKRLIKERMGHREKVLKTIEDLHTNFEECLTRLSEITVEIASVGMGGDEEVKFESYLDQLQVLASQASEFRKET